MVDEWHHPIARGVCADKRTTEDCFCKKPIRNTCGRIWNPPLQLEYFNILLLSRKSKLATNTLGGNTIYATSDTTNFGRFGQLPSNTKRHDENCAVFCPACRPNKGKDAFRIGNCAIVRDGSCARVGAQSNDGIAPTATTARRRHCGDQSQGQNYPVQNCQSQNKRNFACGCGILGLLTCAFCCGTIGKKQSIADRF